MARLAIFTERYTIRRAVELTALTNFRIAAAKLGHDCDFIFRSEILNIPRYDGLLIRALTDPLNTSYVAARLGEVYGLRGLGGARAPLGVRGQGGKWHHRGL